MIYLDHNATTPLEPRVLEAMLPYLTERFGNASSYYQLGRDARGAVEEAREKVAACIGGRSEEIIFTAGGTEADNLALRGVARGLREKGNHLVTSCIEHHAVLETCKALAQEGFEVTMVPVDREVVQALDDHSAEDVRAGEVGHLHSGEHSLEVQVPFLQVVLGEFKVVPIVMGSQNRTSCFDLGEALGAVLEGKQALIVASSDLSHFHDQSTARELDEKIVDNLGSFDPDQLLQDISKRKTEACGGGPMAAAMIAARQLGAKTGENLFYATSGDTSGDYSQVVGYTAGIFYKRAV